MPDYMQTIVRSETASDGFIRATLECGHTVEYRPIYPDDIAEVTRMGCHQCREAGGDAL